MEKQETEMRRGSLDSRFASKSPSSMDAHDNLPVLLRSNRLPSGIDSTRINSPRRASAPYLDSPSSHSSHSPGRTSLSKKHKHNKKKTERLFVTGDPRDLKNIIHDAKKLSHKRETAKKKADKRLKDLLKKIDEKESETKWQIVRLGKEFLDVSKCEFSKEKGELMRIIDELLTLRQYETKLCTMFLFAISPYTRQALAADSFHETLQDQHDLKNVCSKSMIVNSPINSDHHHRRNSHVHQAHDGDLVGFDDGNEVDEDEELNDFEMELVGFQDRLQELQRKVQSQRKDNESPFNSSFKLVDDQMIGSENLNFQQFLASDAVTNVTTRRGGDYVRHDFDDDDDHHLEEDDEDGVFVGDDLHRFSKSKMVEAKSPSPATVGFVEKKKKHNSSPDSNVGTETSSCSSSSSRGDPAKEGVRCRICDEMVDYDTSFEHFEECLADYKQMYNECRIENLLSSLTTAKLSEHKGSKEYGYLEQIEAGLELVLQVRRAEFSFEQEEQQLTDEERMSLMRRASKRFFNVLDSLGKDHRHAMIKAFVLEAIDLAQVQDPSHEFASSGSPRPPQNQQQQQYRKRESVGSVRSGATHLSLKRPTVSDFDFTKVISRGSVGRVFLAIKRNTGDIYAIKVMKKAEIVKKNLGARIVAERNVLARADCPFIVKFFFSFETHSRLFIAMEFVQGGDILQLLNTYGIFPESVVCRYISEIVVALKYLHEQLNVCHRDLKPDNLLIDKHGHIKLTDFGLSTIGIVDGLENEEDSANKVQYQGRHSDPLTRRNGPGGGMGNSMLNRVYRDPLGSKSFNFKRMNTQSKADTIRARRRMLRSQVGTPDYMAPEILLGTGHEFSCDWWSLGIIMYEMLFGIPPFNDETPQRIFNNILSGQLPPESEREPIKVSTTTWDLLRKLLKTNVTERLGYLGASQVQQHLFFKSVDWKRLESGDMPANTAPFIPTLASDLDTSYFQEHHEPEHHHNTDHHHHDEDEDDEDDHVIESPPISPARQSLSNRSNRAASAHSRYGFDDQDDEFPAIDFNYTQLSNLQALNMAAAARINNSKK